MTPDTEAAWLALPDKTRRAVMRCKDAYGAFNVLDRTELSEEAKCEIAGCFPIAATP